jgi:simple sugar transport system permease protein
VHGFASITHRGNQIVSGVAINFIAAGSTIILGQAWFQQGGRTPALGAEQRFEAIHLPFADALRDVPLLGQIYSLISGHSLLTYVAFLMVPVTWWVLYRTRFGLRCARSAKIRRRSIRRDLGDLAALSRRHLHRRTLRPGRLLSLDGANAGFVKDMSAGAAISRWPR